MKKLTVLFFSFCITVAAFAQSEKYVAAMKKNLAAVDSSFRSPAALLTLANSFERIATTEKTEWLPFYYAAFCQVNAGFMEQDKTKVDAIADKANELIAQADALSPNNSEISCIKSLIASCYLMVNPMQRWTEYGQESLSNMEDAQKLDPSNPRPYYLRGQSLKYTPEQFGGGCKMAKPHLQKAIEKYDAFKPASELHPTWGRMQAEFMLAECK
ncbi:MAG TPA: hypothetical protein PKC39_00760 [Ferruginibacter sp.]|nr:hypothetical protein [Ferruginibacter sp.]HMP19462.1 hypothetical protein [Ferruginibacter sp.]